MIAARLGGIFDCAAFAEAQRKVCVCSTETPAVTASARAVAANGAEPLGCVSEAVGSETDPIAGNRINDERNVQRRLESLGFDAGAGTSDPGHSRRLLLCAAAGIDDFEQPCDVGVTPCAVNTAECPAHRVSNRDTCLVDHPCALARIDPDEALPADHFSELVSTTDAFRRSAAAPRDADGDARGGRGDPPAAHRQRLGPRRHAERDGARGEDHDGEGEFRCVHWHVHLAARRAHGGALLRYRVGGDMVPAAPACKTEFAGTCIEVGPEFPARTITVGAWHALHYVGTGDTPTAVQSAASNTPFCTALLDVDYSARIRMHVRSRRQRWLGHHVRQELHYHGTDLRGWPDRPHGHLRRC